MRVHQSEQIVLHGMGVQAPHSDSRPPKRRKDTKWVKMPGMFGGKRVREQVNQSHPYPHYGAPVRLLGTGKFQDLSVYPAKMIALQGYTAERPE